MSVEVVGSFKVTGDSYKKLVATAMAKGLNIASSAGEVTYDSIDFKYTYDGTTMIISVVKKPFFVSYSEISNHLNQIYHEAYNG